MQSSQLQKLLEIIGPARSGVLTIAMVLSVAAAALDAILITAIVPLATGLLSGDASQTLAIDQLSLTSPLALAVIAVVGKNVLQIASTQLISRAGFSVITDGTLRVFRAILDRSTMAGANAGEQQASVITEPVNLVINVVNPLISFISNVISIFVLLLTVAFVAPPDLLPLVAIFIVLFASYTVYSRRMLRASGEARRKAEAERTGFARSALKANGETGYSSWAETVIDRFLRRPTKTVERAIALKWYFTETYKNILELTVVISALIFFLFFSWRDNPELLSQLAALSVAAIRLAPAVNRSMVNFQTLQFGMPSLTALSAIWDEKHQRSGFGLYEASIVGSDPQSFEIRSRGETAATARIKIENGLHALVGQSGIGKTSLLLQMAEAVQDKRVGYLSFVSQDVLVLPAPLHDNIHVDPARTDLDPGTSQTILNLGDTHESLLSQQNISKRNGTNVDAASLSGGQARRLAVMRALASNPNILIADEPTTGLHSEMSETLVEALKSFAAHHVVIVATHDAKLIAAATTVIKL